MSQKCQFEGCSAYALRDGVGFCFLHDMRPEIAERRLAAQSKGGYFSRVRPEPLDLKPPTDAADAIRFLNEITAKVLSGDLETTRYNALVQGLHAWKGLFEVSELEARLKAIEKKLESDKK